MEGQQVTQAEVLEQGAAYGLRNAAERDFQRLYDEVFKTVLRNNREIFLHEVPYAISNLIDNFKYDQGGNYWNNDWESLEVQLAYIFRYASHGAGLTRFKTLDALGKCPELRNILSKPNLSVLSLGCGPANDIVGFLTAMEQSGFKGTLKADLVDCIQGWGESVSVVNNLLLMEQRDQGIFGLASSIFQRNKLNLRFNLRTLPDDNFSLNGYDVIIICKLFSIIEGDQERYIKSLYSTMNESAVILWIDSPFSEYYWEENNFQVLYLSEKIDEKSQGYMSTATTDGFGHGLNDKVSTKARIAVMKKKSIN